LIEVMVLLKVGLGFIFLMSTTAFANTKPFRIAALYPLNTGKDDFVCITESAVKRANSSKHPVFTLDVFDTQNNDLVTIQATQKIIDGKYDAVVGTRTTQEAIGAAELLKQSKTPFFATMSAHPKITAGNKHVVRVLGTADKYAHGLAEFAIQELKAVRIAIVVNLSLDFSVNSENLFSKSIATLSTKLGLPPIIFERIEIIEGQKDFKKIGLQIKDFAPDVVYLPIYSPQAAAVYAELRRVQYAASLISNAGVWDGASVFAGEKNYDPKLRFFYNGIWNLDPVGPYAAIFRAIVSEDCPKAGMTARSGPAFDAIQWLLHTVKDAPDLRHEELVRHAKLIKYPGVLGTVLHDGNAEPIRPMVIYEYSRTGSKIAKVIP
jgi:ABC-type branched-subunit amino acid transport system substrate-binding protein